MAQEVSTAYRTAALSQFRRPVKKVEIEWADGVWTDETDYLLEGMAGDSRVSARSAGPSAIGPGIADSLTVGFRNTDGHFNGKDYDGFNRRIRASVGFTWTIPEVPEVPEVPAATYAEVVLADAPVGYWRLGEASGATSFADSSGHGHTGTAVNSPVAGVAGIIKNDASTAVDQHASVNAAIQVPSHADFGFTTELTVEAWIHGGWNPIGRAGSFRFDQTLGGVTLFYVVGSDGNTYSVQGGDPIAAGKHHIVGRFDNGLLSLFVDGILAGDGESDTATGAFEDEKTIAVSSLQASTNPLSMLFDGTEYMVGTIDEVAVYDYALPVDRIVAHFEKGAEHFGQVIQDTVVRSFLKLDETVGTTAANAAAGGAPFNATNVGGLVIGEPGLVAGDLTGTSYAQNATNVGYLQIPNTGGQLDFGSILLGCHIKTDFTGAPSRTMRLFHKPGCYGLYLYNSGGAKLKMWLKASGVEHSAEVDATPLLDGEPHFVCGYWSDQLGLFTRNFYIQIDDTRHMDAAATPNYAIDTDAGPLYLFAEGPAVAETFDGWMDDAFVGTCPRRNRLYSYAYSAEFPRSVELQGVPAIPAVPAYDVTEYLGQFIGYLQEPTFQSVPETVQFTCLDYASKAVTQETSTAVYEDLRSDEYLEALRARLVPAVTWDDGHPHPGTNQIAFAWLDNESVWEEMQRVTSAEGGRLYFAKYTGLLRFSPYSDLLLAPPDNAAILTTARFSNLNRKRDWQNAKNHVIVQYRTRYKGGEQTIWQSQESIHLLPGASFDVVAQLDVPAISVVAPVAGQDYVARSAAYGVFTSEVAAAIIGTPSAQQATIRLANANTTKSRYVESLQLRGVPVLAGPQRIEQSIDSSWDAVYGRRVLTPPDNPFIQDTPLAQAIAQMLKDRYAPPRVVFEVNDSPGQPWLELGDLVTVQDRFGASVDGYLVGIAWTWDHGYRAVYTVAEAVAFAPYSPGDYFIVGLSALGESKRAYY